MTSAKTEDLHKLEKQHNAQLLGLGAAALEMHQSGQIDEDQLMTLAAKVAETERELRLRRAG